MAIISFENITPDGSIADVPDGFRKLDWDNFVAVDDKFLERAIGNTNAVRTGEAAAFNVPGETASFKSADRDDDFDLNSGYFTAINQADGIANDLQIKFVGFDDGKKVATKVFSST